MDKDRDGSEPDAKGSNPDTEMTMKKRDTPRSICVYSRDELLEVRESPGASRRPLCLSKEFNTMDGVWDPEKWSRSFDASGTVSPLNFGDPREKRRPSDIVVGLMKRRLSDPKERLREERDCIVLSPQRRSFGTGCHVTTSTSLSRQTSCPADFKEGSDRDRDRRDSRRIGSGRIQIDRERDQNRDRDFRGTRDRFEHNDSRRFEAPASRFSRREVDDRERRDFRDRTSYGSRRRDYNRPPEEEPEWFSGGPASQSETIELRGFETSSRDIDEEPDEHEVASDKADEERNRNERAGSISVSDRNGSLETNESSSPENSPPSLHASRQTPSGNSLFDFNEFFKIENVIPGLNEPPTPGPEIEGAGSSRFSHWFSVAHSQGNSRNNSRRSSMNEEFGYLNEILGGSKSPGIPSPSQMFVKVRSADKPGTPVAIVEALANQKAANNPVLDALLQKNATFDQKAVASPGSAVNVKDAELQLKALLFGGRKDSATSSSNSSSTPGMSPLTIPGRVKTVAELEAGMRHQATRNAAINSLLPSGGGQQQPQEKDEGDLTAFNKLLCLMTAGASGQESPKQSTPQPRSMSPLQQLTIGQMGAVQNDFVQALLKNREQQRQIQQQTLQQMRHQNPQHLQQLQIQQALLQQQLAAASAGDPIPQALLHQQMAGDPIPQALLHQQMAGRPSAPPTPPTGGGGPDPILNFIKQNPTIVTKPPSPQIQSPQLPAMLHTSTPRVPSPVPLIAQQNLLQQQPPPSPRVPSPIMFSQQPPGHLSAPSPVHPNQMAMTSPSPNLGSNTLTTTPVMPRVPSPQELRVHTQCIMHNALIKKQLEDQKERFFRKQQERVKSPNPGCMNLNRPPPPIAPMATVRTSLPAAFTPTSVMRKMHSERAEKQSKNDGLDGMQDSMPPGPCKQLMRPDGFLEMDSIGGLEQYPDHFDPTILNGPPPSMERMVAPGSNGATPSINVNNMAGSMRPNLQGSAPGVNSGPGGISSQQGVAGLAASLANPEQMTPSYGPADPLSPKHSARAVFGQSVMQGSPMVTASTPLGPGPGRPIVKGVGGSVTTPVATPSATHLRPMMTSMHQGYVDPSVGHRAIVGIPSGGLDVGTQPRHPARQLSVSPSPLAARTAGVSPTPFPLSMTGGVPVQTGPNTSVGMQHAATNAYILQQMLHGAISPSASPNVRCNLNTLNQLAAYQAQQSRPMDPRVPPRGMYPPVIAPRPILPSTMGFGAPGATPLGHNISPQMQKTMLNSPSAMAPGPGMQFGGMNGNNNVKPGEANLMRWFGSDMLKKQLPSMPPLPTQGQKVMTLDELELC